MTDFIILAVVAVIIALAALYIWKSKKNGRKCIGCPDSGACSGSCAGCSGSCDSHKHSQ